LFSQGTLLLLEDVAPLLGETIRRFQAETELALYRENLEHLVKQRTAEFEAANAQLQGEVAQRKRTETELRRTAAELERSNCDLEQFAYVASHDLQEPLRAISGYLKLLQQRFPEHVDTKAREYVGGVVEAAGRMQTLIRDLLAFARVGSPSTSTEAVDLNKALADALRNLGAATESAGATVSSERLPLVSLDYSLAVQLFQNLIGNAIKFRGLEPPQVHVSAREEGDQCVVSVRDNGIGIDPHYHQRIFQVFQRLHTRKQYPGTGIGLALCKRIVERSGGRIWVESQIGNGSVFCFALPRDAGKKESP
jgi:light-regulated signal transduction histidine kinase (bacteriophytochrome)